MATETQTLKSGSQLFFSGDNLYPYWEPVPNARKMDIVWQDILEGTNHSWSTDPKYVWQKGYCSDADDANIPPSKKGDSAGAYLGENVTDVNGTLYLKVDFPFTFYNLDGTNHDQESTIWAWVKSDEVALKKDSAQTIKELSDSLGLTGPNAGLTGSGTGSGSGSSTTTIVIIVAVLVFIGLMIFAFRKKKPVNGQPQNPTQNPAINIVRIPKKA